ncbi:MAG TPA: right-handed parallel beta-helix repeat-containing protein, partial [Anaerolineae bacterium]
DTHTKHFANPAGHPPGAFGDSTPHAFTYVVWNVREGMLAPGQWYLDRTRQRIVYWPLAGESVKEAIVGVRTCLIRLDGHAGAPVSGVTIRGITLAGATTPLVAADFGAEKLDGALSGNGPIQDCLFEHLTIKHVAGHGIKLRGDGNRNLCVQACEISTIGAGGIYLSGEDCVIAHNTIAHTGLSYPAAIGIFFAGKRNVVSHNDIHDTSYSGIDAGGGVGHRIEYNRFERVMRVLNDGAAIYVFANQGTIIQGNVAANIGGGPGARHAYYLDERSENCLVAGNLAVDVPWCLHNHMAHHNTISDNVCIVHGDMKISFPRSDDYCLERNIFYATGSIRFIGVEGIAHFGQNIFYSAEGWVEGVHLVDYTETDDLVTFTSDARTCLADPCFVDVEQDDLRLRSDSPAHALGIPALDVSQIFRTKE